MEAVFPPKNVRIFSDDFRPIFRRKAQKICWNLPEKNPENSHWNTASTSGDFRCIPAESGDFFACFLHVTVGSGDRNVRPGIVSAKTDYKDYYINK
jgi:hypothetical protein